MTVLSPWALLGLLAVAIVAAWTLMRPGRQLLVVGSLRLWRQAVAALESKGTLGARKIELGWALLLAGAVLAVGALAQPVLSRQSPRRHVAVVIYPSAELGNGAARQWQGPIFSLLKRLDGADQVMLLLPAQAGGVTEWLSPSAAAERVKTLAVFPATQADLSVPLAPAEAQATYVLAPRAIPESLRPGQVFVPLPADVAPVTVERLAAEALPAGGQVQTLVSLRNHTAKDVAVTVSLWLTGGDGRLTAGPSQSIVVRPGTPRPVIFTHGMASAVGVVVAGDGVTGRPGTVGALTRVDRPRLAVALVGTDNPYLRRFLAAATNLRLVDQAQQADVVLASAVMPPPDKPAMLIDPPEAGDPPLWRRGPLAAAVALGDANVNVGTPLFRDVDVAGVAVRNVRPWVGELGPGQTLLMGYRGDALALASEDPAGQAPRKVYVAFDLASENTNFALQEGFVVFLARAVAWLGQTPSQASEYVCLAPASAGGTRGFERVWPVDGADATGGGIYRDAAGNLEAVSLLGLRTPPAMVSVEPQLPQPVEAVQAIGLWRALAVLAMMLWMAGWWVRTR